MAAITNKRRPLIQLVTMVCCCVLFSANSYGQLQDSLKAKTLQFMEALNAGDSAAVASFFLKDATVYHADEDTLVDLTVEEFCDLLGDFKSKKFQEDFFQIDVSCLDNGFCYTDVKLRFYMWDEMAFMGNDHYIWLQKGDDYFIQSVYSSKLPLKPTLTPSPGSDDPVNQLNNLMNKWHKDAALSRLEDYFSFMDESFYYLGTDPEERWSKKEFYEFSKPYFDQEKGWHFIANWRNWYFSWDGETAWFEESLDTHMEECRGTGVAVLMNGEWKLVHYNLTVVIENEKMKSFIKLRQKD